MKKYLLILFSISIFILSTSSVILKKANGVAGRTGSPAESTCAACHYSGAGVTSVSITGTPDFTNNLYIPGETYTVSVSVSSTALTHFGFGCEILNGTDVYATNSGVITGIAGSTKTMPSGSKTNAVHISSSAGSGTPSTRTFSFTWIAPTTGTTSAIYAAGLAVNGNGSDGAGDLTATSSLILSPDPTVPTGIKTNFQNTELALKVFPNPASELLHLSYNLAMGGNVKAVLYNLQGKTIATLFSEIQVSGSHTKTESLAPDLCADLYVVKLFVNEIKLAEKLIVIR